MHLDHHDQTEESTGKQIVMGFLYGGMAIVLVVVAIVFAVLINRRRKKKLIQSQSVDANTGSLADSANSKSNEFKQLQNEIQRQHLKKQNADIEEIVKMQKLTARRK